MRLTIANTLRAISPLICLSKLFVMITTRLTLKFLISEGKPILSTSMIMGQSGLKYDSLMSYERLFLKKKK
jgi:hypothetical protein